MVLNCSVAAAVVTVSANACQYIACNPQRFSGDQVLRLLFCYPCQSFRLWACLCFPILDSSDSDTDTDTDTDTDGSHSD